MLATENLSTKLFLIPIGFAVVLILIALPQLVRLLLRIRDNVITPATIKVFQEVIEPDKDFWQSIVLITIADLIFLTVGQFISKSDFIRIIELPVGLSLALTMSWLGSRFFERFFKIYVTQVAITENKINEDLFIFFRWLSFFIFLFIVIAIFSQTHQINILGLIASLGVGGIAVAFAAQKVLEQLLGGIVLYLDRPFKINDYISLPDGTFGKVESIGLRSTKIRISGKGTLTVVPNNYLIGINVENFTGAGKMINVLKLNFYKQLSKSEQAFIQQLILDSSINTEIDSRSITISFQDLVNDDGENFTQGQVKYFIHSAGELSKEFRIQIINVVGENIRQQLLENDINYQVVDQVWIDSHISI